MLPSIPDAAPARVKNGLAIRNACAVDGVCPDCKTSGTVTADTEHDGVFHLVFEHERGCAVLADEGAP